MKLSKGALTSGYMTTEEFGNVIRRNPQTIRKTLCDEDGKSAYGVTPIKIKNRLMWPTSEVVKLFPDSIKIQNVANTDMTDAIEITERLACANRQLLIMSNIFDEYGIVSLASGYELHLPERLILLLAKQEQKQCHNA